MSLLYFRTFALAICIAFVHAALAIVGGEEVRLLSGQETPYPFMVSIQDAPRFEESFSGSGANHGCGGVLVGAELVLTAAHCVGSDIYQQNLPSHIWSGGVDRQLSASINTVKDIIFFQPDYIADGSALAILNQPFSSQKVIRIAQESDLDLVENQAFSLGWGMTKTPVNPQSMSDEELWAIKSPLLKRLNLSLLSYTQIRDAPNITFWALIEKGIFPMIKLADSPVLAVGVPPKFEASACYFDSGGPLVIQRVSGQQVVAGTVFGSFGKNHCADRSPAPFAINNVVFGYQPLMQLLGASSLLPFSRYAITERQKIIATTLDRIRTQISPSMQSALGQLFLDTSTDITAHLDSLHPNNLSLQLKIADALAFSFSSQASQRLFSWHINKPLNLDLQPLNLNIPINIRTFQDQQYLNEVHEHWKTILGNNTAVYLDTSWLKITSVENIYIYTLGIEHRLNPSRNSLEHIIGFSANYLTGALQGWHIGLMANQLMPKNGYLAAYLGAGHFKFHQARILSLGNGESGLADTNMRSTLLQTAIELGKQISTHITPYIRLDWQHYAIQDYQETSTTVFPLNVSTTPTTALHATIGARASWLIESIRHWQIRPSLNLNLKRNIYRDGGHYSAKFTDPFCASIDCHFNGVVNSTNANIISSVAIEAGLDWLHYKKAQLKFSYRTQPLASASQRVQELKIHFLSRW